LLDGGVNHKVCICVCVCDVWQEGGGLARNKESLNILKIENSFISYNSYDVDACDVLRRTLHCKE